MKPMTKEEYHERIMIDGYYKQNCYCNATEFPPCGICEGDGFEKLYDDYLHDFEIEMGKIND